MISKLVAVLCQMKGGFRFLSILSKFIPQLKEFPICFPLPKNVVIKCDLSEDVFFPLLKYGHYPYQAVEDFILISTLSNEDVFIDVGANIGYLSSIAAGCVGPHGQVHAFEPAKRLQKYLSQLAAQISQIHIWPIALSDTCETLNFIESASSNMSHVSAPSEICTSSYLVNAINLDTWMDNVSLSRINFLKIDAEGHDLKVLSGAVNLLSKFKPLIMFEAFNINSLSNIARILNDIPDAQYSIYRIHNKFPVSTSGRETPTNNYLAIPCSINLNIPNFLFERGLLVNAIDLL